MNENVGGVVDDFGSWVIQCTQWRLCWSLDTFPEMLRLICIWPLNTIEICYFAILQSVCRCWVEIEWAVTKSLQHQLLQPVFATSDFCLQFPIPQGSCCCYCSCDMQLYLWGWWLLHEPWMCFYNHNNSFYLETYEKTVGGLSITRSKLLHRHAAF